MPRRMLLLSLMIVVPLASEAAPPAAQPGSRDNALAVLSADLKSENVATRREAAKRLAAETRLPVELLPALIRALKDRDDSVAGQAVEAIVRVGPAAITPVSDLVTAEERPVREGAVRALSKLVLQSPDAVPPLVRALGDDDSDAPGIAARALAKVGPPVLPALTRALADEDARIRTGAAEALGYMGAQAGPAIPRLERLLSDPDLVARYAAAWALVKIDPKHVTAVPALLDALGGGLWSWQGRAAEALEIIGPSAPEVAPALRKIALETRDPATKGIAVRLLAKLNQLDADVITARAQELRHKDPLVRSNAAQALGNLGPDARPVIPALVQAMEDEVAYVRMYAAEALSKMGEAGVAALARTVTHKDLYVRQQAVTMLNRMTPLPEQAVPALIAALRDANDRIRLEAASALTRSGYASAQDALAEFRAAEAQRRDRARQRAMAEAGRLYSQEEATAAVPADDQFKYPLELEHQSTVRTPQGKELLLTLHRGTDRPDRLVIWEKLQEGYRILKKLEAQEGPGFSSFDVPSSFEWQGEVFLHVALLYAGTGHHREDTIFAVLPDGTLKHVKFEPAPTWYKNKLAEGEGVWKGPVHEFSDNDLRFTFYIWNRDDGNCCPTAGKVTGTYKIVKQETFTVSTKGHDVSWTMIVDSHHREPIGKAPDAIPVPEKSPDSLGEGRDAAEHTQHRPTPFSSVSTGRSFVP